MDPIKPPDFNFTYHGPPGTDVLPLDVHRDAEEGAVMSAWRPSAEELAKLNAGGAVELWVHLMPPPPVSVGVCGPVNAKGEEATWNGATIGYTWPERPDEAVDDDAPTAFGVDPAGEKPTAADAGDASGALREDASST